MTPPVWTFMLGSVKAPGNAADSASQEQGGVTDPIVAVDGDLMRHIGAGDYVATIEPTRRLGRAALDGLYEKTLAALGREVGIGVTLKLVQHVRANLDYYVEFFSAKEQVSYFCTDHIEDAIRIRVILRRLGRSQKILLLYASSPELADLYVEYEIEPCVFDPWWVERAARHRTKAGGPLKIHLWLDVGMSREGLLPEDIGRILPSLGGDAIVVEGLGAHFNAVEQDLAIQKSRFDDALRFLRGRGIRPRIAHAVGSHNGLGYNDLTGAFSSAGAGPDVLYDMIRPGACLGMGARFDLEDHQEEVLRVSIPVREARIAHVKTMPAGWNLGYGDNKFRVDTRIAVLEGTRVNSLRYEAFHRPSQRKGEALRSRLCHGRIACVEISAGEWGAGDLMTCDTTIWISFLTKAFERMGERECRVSVQDARSGEVSRVPIAVRRDPPNEHLLLRMDQFLTALFTLQLEGMGSTRCAAWLAKTVLVRAAYGALVCARRMPFGGRKVSSVLAPVSMFY